MSIRRSEARDGVGGAPPSPNRGAQITSSALIDWLGYTAGSYIGGCALYEGAGEEDWTLNSGKGRYGYESEDCWCSAKRWRAAGRDSHVELTGTACRELECAATSMHGALWSWPEHLSWLLEAGASVSRLDFAIDVYGGDMSPQELVAAANSGLVKSRWDLKKGRQVNGLMEGPAQGHTVYLGSPASDSLIRCYDKRAEQGLSELTPTWTRFELQMRRQPARKLAAAIAVNGMAGGLAVLRGYLDVLDSTGRVDTRWLAICEGVKAAPLHVQKSGTTLDKKREWVARTVAPTLALLAATAPDEAAYLAELLAMGRAAWSAQARSLAEERMQTGFEPDVDRSGRVVYT